MKSAGLPPLQQLPQSDRVELRPVDDRDLDLVLDAATDPLIPVITTVPSVQDPVEAQAYIERQHGRPGEGQGWSLTIIDRATNTPVGNLFVSLLLRGLRCAEIGYWTGPSHRGNGLAAEALALVRDWAPQEFDVDQLTLYIDPENAPSLRTAERCGFEHIGENAAWELVGDEFRPMTVWRHGRDGPEPELGRLETRSWQYEYRSDARWFGTHLHEDLVEHCCFGTRSNRDEMLTGETNPVPAELPLRDLDCRQLDDNTWMVTYLWQRSGRICRRASIWQRTPEGWRMRFHQGTHVPE